MIATYALCGFANVGSIGIQLGGLTPMAPERKGDLADVAIRALVAGTVACFMTACIAGKLSTSDSDTNEGFMKAQSQTPIKIRRFLLLLHPYIQSMFILLTN